MFGSVYTRREGQQLYKIEIECSVLTVHTILTRHRFQIIKKKKVVIYSLMFSDQSFGCRSFSNVVKRQSHFTL